MVFAWGTGYKLSLYKPTPQNENAPAKLCTLASDAARSAVVEASNRPKPLVVASLLLPPVFHLHALKTIAHQNVDDGRATNPSPFYPPAALDFRPPPTQILKTA
jgi:hypothetical protein